MMRSGLRMDWSGHFDVDSGKGLYEFQLYRWPIESGRRIVANEEGLLFGTTFLPRPPWRMIGFRIETDANPGTAAINTAHLIIGNHPERQAEVNPDMRTASFLVHLKTWRNLLTSLVFPGAQKPQGQLCAYPKDWSGRQGKIPPDIRQSMPIKF